MHLPHVRHYKSIQHQHFDYLITDKTKENKIIELTKLLSEFMRPKNGFSTNHVRYIIKLTSNFNDYIKNAYFIIFL